MATSKKDWNKPRCPICHMPLVMWVAGADVINAECYECDWSWRG